MVAEGLRARSRRPMMTADTVLPEVNSAVQQQGGEQRRDFREAFSRSTACRVFTVRQAMAVSRGSKLSDTDGGINCRSSFSSSTVG